MVLLSKTSTNVFKLDASKTGIQCVKLKNFGNRPQVKFLKIREREKIMVNLAHEGSRGNFNSFVVLEKLTCVNCRLLRRKCDFVFYITW